MPRIKWVDGHVTVIQEGHVRLATRVVLMPIGFSWNTAQLKPSNSAEYAKLLREGALLWVTNVVKGSR